MQICDNCGHKPDDDSKFCSKCGTKLSNVEFVSITNVYHVNCYMCGAIIKVVSPCPGKTVKQVVSTNISYDNDVSTRLPCPKCNSTVEIIWKF